MTARTVGVPTPRGLRSLIITGPISPMSASSPQTATLSLFTALAEAADDEASESGWCVWWASPPRHAGNVARVDLWADDDSGGRQSVDAAQGRLEAAGFMVQTLGKRTTPAAILRGDSPLHARLGSARLGLLAGDTSVPFELLDDVEGVEVEPRWRWPVQPCPSCGHQAHPVERIAGFPSGDAMLAVELGEAVLAGCLVDDASDHDAECSSCGHGFEPRYR